MPPPLTGVAEKVTEVPAQTGLEEELIETLTGTLLFAVIVIVFDVAGLPAGQTMFDVRMHETWSPLTGV